ncbi:hypothetical protein KSX_53160 [Ktedonospora formicarum]|uniref:Uncharacterized protein n=1 Tax=Ktedonospora formicarum TaxID=2778364 RepID=A0A8J3I4Y5_9CHLR|nr:hypothetical protein KSX_53160 [Ktedonospora formicarum]
MLYSIQVYQRKSEQRTLAAMWKLPNGKHIDEDMLEVAMQDASGGIPII